MILGGTLINPLTQTTQLVSLNTMQLNVERKGQEAFITKDSLRVDIEAEFYVKIEPNEEDLLIAVASLGDKTLTPDSVSKLLEGKLIGTLRSVAATMDLQELHEKRQEFADQVQEACRDDLMQNGFKLESVAVTNLDQTPLEMLDENNRFDVVAIQTIKKEVEERQTETAKIEHENEVKREEDRLRAELSIKEKEEETKLEELEIDKRLAVAEEEQQREIEIEKVKQEQEIEEAKLKQKQAIETARITQEENIKTAEITQLEKIETAEITKKIVLIEKEREEREATATSEIVIAEKEKERDLAEVTRLEASAQKATAEAQVETATMIEETERQSKMALIEAEQKADETRIDEERRADAEAYKIVEIAKAELEAAKLKAEADRLRAEAELIVAKAEAEGQEEIIAAKNTAEEKVLINEAVISLIDALPTALEQLMKPAEKIESIRVLDLGNGSGNSGNKILKAILGAGAAIPALKEILNLADLEPENLKHLISNYVSNSKQTDDQQPTANSQQQRDPKNDSS